VLALDSAISWSIDLRVIRFIGVPASVVFFTSFLMMTPTARPGVLPRYARCQSHVRIDATAL
jgi:hypothetical protein